MKILGRAIIAAWLLLLACASPASAGSYDGTGPFRWSFSIFVAAYTAKPNGDTWDGADILKNHGAFPQRHVPPDIYIKLRSINSPEIDGTDEPTDDCKDVFGCEVFADAWSDTNYEVVVYDHDATGTDEDEIGRANCFLGGGLNIGVCEPLRLRGVETGRISIAKVNPNCVRPDKITDLHREQAAYLNESYKIIWNSDEERFTPGMMNQDMMTLAESLRDQEFWQNVMKGFGGLADFYIEQKHKDIKELAGRGIKFYKFVKGRNLSDAEVWAEARRQLGEVAADEIKGQMKDAVMDPIMRAVKKRLGFPEDMNLTSVAQAIEDYAPVNKQVLNHALKARFEKADIVTGIKCPG